MHSQHAIEDQHDQNQGTAMHDNNDRETWNKKRDLTQDTVQQQTCLRSACDGVVVRIAARHCTKLYRFGPRFVQLGAQRFHHMVRRPGAIQWRNLTPSTQLQDFHKFTQFPRSCKTPANLSNF